MITPHGHGFIYQEPTETDLVFGSAKSVQQRFGGEVLNKDGDWTQWLPDEEKQSTPTIETNSCVSFGTNNCTETLSRFLFGVALNLSDRFLSKSAETDPARGNTPGKVGDTLRHKWSVDETEWPFTEDMTLEEFFKDIPQNLKTLAVGRGAEFEFGYERVSTDNDSLREALRYSPLGVSVPAWFQDETGRYYRPQGMSDNHWCECYYIDSEGNKYIFDTYYPYKKILRANCVPMQAMRYYLKRNIVSETWWSKFLTLLNKYVFGKKV